MAPRRSRVHRGFDGQPAGAPATGRRAGYRRAGWLPAGRLATGGRAGYRLSAGRLATAGASATGYRRAGRLPATGGQVGYRRARRLSAGTPAICEVGVLLTLTLPIPMQNRPILPANEEEPYGEWPNASRRRRLGRPGIIPGNGRQDNRRRGRYEALMTRRVTWTSVTRGHQRGSISAVHTNPGKEGHANAPGADPTKAAGCRTGSTAAAGDDPPVLRAGQR